MGLLAELERQAKGLPVEVLALWDSHLLTVGEKRNRLLDAARGRYLSFVDDDDWVAPTYVTDILEAAERGPDVVVFDQIVTIDGGGPKRCIYGVKYYPSESASPWVGRPAHTHAWKSEIAKGHRFPDKNRGEDREWADAACQDVSVEGRIEKVLYFYRFSRERTLTRDSR